VPADRASPDRARLAAQALAEAKADARARGDFASPRGGDPPGDPPAHGRAARPPVTPPARGGDDPQRLAGAIEGLLDTRGWQQQAAIGSVFGRWAEIVGHDLAAHTRPDAFADGELAVIADSTAWATQVRLLASVLVARLNAELGHGTVRRVKVRGPAPPRQRGAWRVPGSKGPGDTYG
jgi:predicted nucleic acid-binding Zn ribbon protein